MCDPPAATGRWLAAWSADRQTKVCDFSASVKSSADRTAAAETASCQGSDEVGGLSAGGSGASQGLSAGPKTAELDRGGLSARFVEKAATRSGGELV